MGSRLLRGREAQSSKERQKRSNFEKDEVCRSSSWRWPRRCCSQGRTRGSSPSVPRQQCRCRSHRRSCWKDNSRTCECPFLRSHPSEGMCSKDCWDSQEGLPDCGGCV